MRNTGSFSASRMARPQIRAMTSAMLELNRCKVSLEMAADMRRPSAMALIIEAKLSVFKL